MAQVPSTHSLPQRQTRQPRARWSVTKATGLERPRPQTLSLSPSCHATELERLSKACMAHSRDSDSDSDSNAGPARVITVVPPRSALKDPDSVMTPSQSVGALSGPGEQQHRHWQAPAVAEDLAACRAPLYGRSVPSGACTRTHCSPASPTSARPRVREHSPRRERALPFARATCSASERGLGTGNTTVIPHCR